MFSRYLRNENRWLAGRQRIKARRVRGSRAALNKAAWKVTKAGGRLIIRAYSGSLTKLLMQICLCHQGRTVSLLWFVA